MEEENVRATNGTVKEGKWGRTRRAERILKDRARNSLVELNGKVEEGKDVNGRRGTGRDGTGGAGRERGR